MEIFSTVGYLLFSSFLQRWIFDLLFFYERFSPELKIYSAVLLMEIFSDLDICIVLIEIFSRDGFFTILGWGICSKDGKMICSSDGYWLCSVDGDLLQRWILALFC